MSDGASASRHPDRLKSDKRRAGRNEAPVALRAVQALPPGAVRRRRALESEARASAPVCATTSLADTRGRRAASPSQRMPRNMKGKERRDAPAPVDPLVIPLGWRRTGTGKMLPSNTCQSIATTFEDDHSRDAPQIIKHGQARKRQGTHPSAVKGCSGVPFSPVPRRAASNRRPHQYVWTHSWQALTARAPRHDRTAGPER